MMLGLFPIAPTLAHFAKTDQSDENGDEKQADHDGSDDNGPLVTWLTCEITDVDFVPQFVM